MAPTPPQPIAVWNTARDAWETPDTQGLLCEHLAVYSGTFPTSGITQRGTAYQLPMSAPPMGVPESLLLPTPTVVEIDSKQSVTLWLAKTRRLLAMGMPAATLTLSEAVTFLRTKTDLTAEARSTPDGETTPEPCSTGSP